MYTYALYSYDLYSYGLQNYGRFEAWLDSLPANVKLAVVEIGAGKTIPTARRTRFPYPGSTTLPYPPLSYSTLHYPTLSVLYLPYRQHVLQRGYMHGYRHV